MWGAIANDVHGKNHHQAGSFCDALLWLDLLLADGEIIRCSEKKNKEIFRATCGGIGLTGVILSACFKLAPICSSWIYQTSWRAKNLKEMIEIFQQNETAPFSMAWIDTMASKRSIGRGIIFNGRYATKKECQREGKTPLHFSNKKKIKVPFFLPKVVINPLTLAVMNEVYYRYQSIKSNPGKDVKVFQFRKIKSYLVDYETFFYPLDSILHWNRGYGKRGFTQYQCLLPKKRGAEATEEILTTITQLKRGSFLTVFKHMGKGNKNYLSFSDEGYTLAMDFPINHQNIELLKKLDKIVEKYEGRLYLAKDVLMSKDFFQKSYPQISQFMKVKKRVDPHSRFSSLMSKRLGLTS